jgi:hypothetical protein
MSKLVTDIHVIQVVSTRRSSQTAEFYAHDHIRFLYKNQRLFEDVSLGFGKLSEEIQRKENAPISAKCIYKGGNIAAIRELAATLGDTANFEHLSFERINRKQKWNLT